MIYGKEDLINQIIIADLGSTDDTVKIIEKIGKDYDYIKPIKWKDCKEINRYTYRAKNRKCLTKEGKKYNIKEIKEQT